MKTLPGHDVYKLDATQLAAWDKALEPLRVRWAENVKKLGLGLDPDKVMGELEADLKKYGAAD